MAVEDYENFELTPELLKDLCLDELGISWHELPLFLEKVESIRKLAESLDISRFYNLHKMTTKKDKMDCPYVRQCLVLLMKRRGEVSQLKELISGEVYNDKG